jgi:hypothetical protein
MIGFALLQGANGKRSRPHQHRFKPVFRSFVNRHGYRLANIQAIDSDFLPLKWTPDSHMCVAESAKIVSRNAKQRGRGTN